MVWGRSILLATAFILNLGLVPADATAKGSAIVACAKHQFHAFYQNMKTRKIARDKAMDVCTRIGIEKFQMTKDAAQACCARTVRTISSGCVAMASGLSDKKKQLYFAQDKRRISTVLRALETCEKDYFDCQVKVVTCVGTR